MACFQSFPRLALRPNMTLRVQLLNMTWFVQVVFFFLPWHALLHGLEWIKETLGFFFNFWNADLAFVVPPLCGLACPAVWVLAWLGFFR